MLEGEPNKVPLTQKLALGDKTADGSGNMRMEKQPYQCA